LRERLAEGRNLIDEPSKFGEFDGI
jgi:hypothetical protein